MLGPAARLPPRCPARSRRAARNGRCNRGTEVLPRKEVIQPQLPLRLPCSRGSPCRHEARTISSSSSLELGSNLEQTALPRVPRTNSRHEGPAPCRTHVEPPEIWISETAWIVKAAAADALRFENLSQHFYISGSISISLRFFCTNCT